MQTDGDSNIVSERLFLQAHEEGFSSIRETGQHASNRVADLGKWDLLHVLSKVGSKHNTRDLMLAEKARRIGQLGKRYGYHILE